MSDDEDGFPEEFTQSINRETSEWLQETYPDAKGVQEAIRMAIRDARAWNTRVVEDGE